MLHQLSRWVRGTYVRLFRRDEYERELKSFEDGLIDIQIKQVKQGWQAHSIWESSPAVAILAEEVGKYLDKEKVVNFMQFDMFDPVNMKKYRMTLQRWERPSPAQIISILRPVVERMAEQGDFQAQMALQRCGYDEDEVPV